MHNRVNQTEGWVVKRCGRESWLLGPPTCSITGGGKGGRVCVAIFTTVGN